jgi:hypothetical protein
MEEATALGLTNESVKRLVLEQIAAHRKRLPRCKAEASALSHRLTRGRTGATIGSSRTL